MKKAVLLMAHGAPRNLNEVEEFVLHIRHGRPLEATLMADIVSRYRRIGGSPLFHWTQRQAELLRDCGAGRVFIGMRHSHPFIEDTVREMISDGVDSIVAICMAPQFSRMTIGAYQKALEDAIARTRELHASALQYELIESFGRHPLLIDAFHSRLAETKNQHPEALVLFTAHSLPVRVLQEGDPYDWEVKETARLLARAGNLSDWKFAYQSQGLIDEKWLGPTVESRIDELAFQGRSEMIIHPVGFVCDHVEILYDIDIAFREYAQKKGIQLYRVPSLNDSKEFIQLLFRLVSERL
jgi:protoporphyrin/coproporphyrin ferrochelatase